MTKKKLAILICGLSLIGAMGVGATLAYFTDSEEVTNVVTMGHVDIELFETNEDGEEVGLDGEGLTFENVVPGQTVEKNPTVRVKDGSQPCYVRMTLDVTAPENTTLTEADIDALVEELSDQIVESEDWTLTDGYFYYAKKMDVDDTATLFETVTIPAQWANNTADQEFSIVLAAEAIQSENLKDDLLTMDGEKVIAWNLGEISIESYEAPSVTE